MANRQREGQHVMGNAHTQRLLRRSSVHKNIHQPTKQPKQQHDIERYSATRCDSVS